MPILMQMKWPGSTREQYEAVRKSVAWETDKPEGGRFHVAAFDEHGLRVVDLWDSAEHFNRFVEKRLMPGVKAAGIPGEPQVEILPVHAIFAPGPFSL
jgi:hypothetical protein